MFSTLINSWKVSDIRKKILYTLLLIVIFRFGTHIPVPGVAKGALQQWMGGGTALGDLLDLFSGGAFYQASIFAMSITPYVNSSIIMNLLTVAIPALERLVKDGGEEGKKIIAQYTRYGTVVLALIQATGFYFILRSTAIDNNGTPALADLSVLSAFAIILSFTAGTAFLMWLGEQITEKGIGNGISLLIFAGIVSRLGTAVTTGISYIQGGTSAIIVIVVLIVAVLAVAFVVIMNSAERRVPVQYAKRMVGRKMYGGQSTHIPIKLSMAGVIPIIFASSILSFPSTIAQFIPGAKENWFWGPVVSALSPNSWFYAIVYFVLIIGFTFFYTAITFNPMEVANNMKKNGGFVPGIRPGRPTFEFINKITNRITLVGALCLGVIAVLPILVNLGLKIQGLSIGGTSLIIVVGVVLETIKQLESQMLMRHYKGFLE